MYLQQKKHTPSDDYNDCKKAKHLGYLNHFILEVKL